VISESICTIDCQMKAVKGMTTMAIKHRTKCHMGCCMDLEILRTMIAATTYRIKLLSTTEAHSDVQPANLSPKSNVKTHPAPAQSPA
jgi:hypothetical protein